VREEAQQGNLCSFTFTVEAIMPNKRVEAARVPRVKGVDKRIQLTPEQRSEIRDNPEGLSTHKLAAKYGVSRRLIQFIQHPERHAKNLLDRQQRGGSMKYYDHEKQAEYMQTHRAHKKRLLEEGVI